ncbi:hypothetical protein ACCS86_37725, partial [Rhizobium ruizarguesonis]
GIDHAGKLHQRAVSHDLDDTAVKLGNGMVEQLAAADLQPCQRGSRKAQIWSDGLTRSWPLM